MPSRMSTVCSMVGSSTMTGWKRRSSAASRSMYLRYSSSVVAPMPWSSPRESGGLGRRRAELAPRERRLEDVRRVDRAFCRARADERVELVDEEDRVVGVPELLDDLLQALLELAAVLGPRDQRPDVEGQDPLVEQGLRNVPVDDPVGQALRDRGLADAGLADQRR